MQPILNNPFRTAGVLVSRERAEERGKLNQLKISAGKVSMIVNDHSFPALGGLYRSFTAVKSAEKILNKNTERMNASVFWFYEDNVQSDRFAFDSLRKHRLTEAKNIWSRMISNQAVRKENASAYFNLGTLYLSDALRGRTDFREDLSKGISLKLKFLDSYFFNDFVEIATDHTFSINRDDVQCMFLWQLFDICTENNYMKPTEFIGMVLELPFSAKQDFLYQAIR